MSTQKAVVLQGEKKASLVTDRPLPRSRSGFLGVRVKAVALNPTDWKHQYGDNNPGSLLGCDYAGVVETLGEGYSKQWTVGDRICGTVHGANVYEKEDGAFAEHIAAMGDLGMRIPDSMSFEEASTIGLGSSTCGQGLFQELKLNLPNNPTKDGKILLIYGGSTATGSLGIQFATLAGYKVITTCSQRNFSFVKSLGAVAAVDYNDTDCAERIQKLSDNNLKLCWDTISIEGSVKICAEALTSGGHYASLLPVKFPRDDVTNNFTLMYTIFNAPVKKRYAKFDAKPEDFKFAKVFFAIVEDLMAQGKIKVHPPKVMEGGLEKVTEGLELLRKDQVSRQKLVYKV